jgi:hypothetical protein
VSPTKTVAPSPRGFTTEAGGGSRPAKSYRVRAQTSDREQAIDHAEAIDRAETIDREQMLARLTHLRAVVPVFAHELASARRQAATLRAANGWLVERVRQLQTGSARGGSTLLRSHTPSGGGVVRDQRASARIRGREKPMAIVELTDDQAASIESLSEECTVVGVHEGRPIVRLSGGDVAILDSDGRLVPAEDAICVLTPYVEVARG